MSNMDIYKAKQKQNPGNGYEMSEKYWEREGTEL
jgi:hypothetical protein